MDTCSDRCRNMVDNTSNPQVAEIDQTGRYVRYHDILGRGAYKTVYKAFDEVEGIEVAWNRVDIEKILQSAGDLGRLYSEVHILKSLRHENILKFYCSWVDEQKKTINIITELFTSGSLREYRMKHKNVDIRAIKSWARQILRGLQYLHGQTPPVLHRDLKCDNIFINGNHGEVKIGDLGLATVMQQPTARSIIGTPEFMAPELYQEEYNELVDIYSFGMCMLEMVTLEYPYSECKTPVQIFKKVTSGKKPAALDTLTDPLMKEFIDKCLVSASHRPSAAVLLEDPFLSHNDHVQLSRSPSQKNPHSRSCSHSTISPEMNNCSDYEQKIATSSSHTNQEASTSNNTNDQVISTRERREEENTVPEPEVMEFLRFYNDFEFRLKGEKTDANSIALELRIATPSKKANNVHFQFYLDSDTALAVATEMVENLSLPDQVPEHIVTMIANFVDFVVMKLAPGWQPTFLTSAQMGEIEEYKVSRLKSMAPSQELQALSLGESSKTGEARNSGNDSRQKDRVVVDEGKEQNEGGCSGTVCDSTPAVAAGEEEDEELRKELEALEMQYQGWMDELLRRRDDAMDKARKMWISRKKYASN